MININQDIKKLNPWWFEKATTEIYSRPEYTNKILEDDSNIINILIGARRVGKTSILYDLISKLTKKINPKQILYFTAELPAIQNQNIKDIIDQFINNFDLKSSIPLYIFIDEIQEIANWQQTIKYYYDTHNIKFYLTGSSSIILNQQTSKLTGRFILHKVLPLSYKEFLSFKSIKTQTNYQADNQTVIEYLESGGYPEYVLRGSDQLLVQTVESVMYRDLLSLYGIRNPAIFKDLLKFLCDKISTPVSLNNISKDLKMDVDTAKAYIQYLIDVYLINPLYRKGKSHKIVKGSAPKYYINDTGVLRLFSTTSRFGHLAENAVYTHLMRMAAGEDIFYDFIEDQEIDFIYKDQKFEVKMKGITNSDPQITYIVKDVDPTIDAPQIPIEKFLLK